MRLRYHLPLKRRGGADALLLAEEVLTLAFTGQPNEPDWLSETDSKHLLDIVPSGNLPVSLVKQQLQHFISSVEAMRPLLPAPNAVEFEACATVGTGVFETLKAVAKGVLSDLKKLSR